MTEITWEGSIVGRIDDEEEVLVAASPEMIKLWDEFRENGITHLTTGLPVRREAMTDRLATSFNLGQFFNALQRRGFGVTQI